VGAGAERDDPRVAAGSQRIVQTEREREVAEVVGRELASPSRAGSAPSSGRAITARVVDEHVQRPAPAGHEGGDRHRVGEVQPADPQSVGAVVLLMSAAVRLPASVSRTASVTSAPAPARARAVSTPMPEEPPVTIARLPTGRCPRPLGAVESNPNLVVMVRWCLS